LGKRRRGKRGIGKEGREGEPASKPWVL